MSGLISTPPFSAPEPVTEILHGVTVTDPYRWLEDQDSARTRRWLKEQTQYARAYLDNIPGRERIRKHIREFLAVETYDSLQKAGNRYFFRKRLPDQEQPCIYMRDGAEGEDELLLNPADRKTGKYTAIKPLRISPDGRLLLYEVKEGGERTGTFECLDIRRRETLSDVLPRGYLRGFAFAPDSKSFYYVHEPLPATRPFHRAAYHHFLGTAFSDDREVFCAGDDEKLRLCLTSDETRLGFSVLVAFLAEQGCLFALPNIRGGSEFGASWHNAAKRRNRQIAYDDFLCAAEWLVKTGRSKPEKLAIFGGSNSGLLVAAAMTQRPELFRAVVCIAPILDMFRYHLFDGAHVWKDEFGTADDPDDFSALRGYSPYHRVRGGSAYPSTMIVSGDADRNCNPLHARKMTARLQAATISDRPIVLDYHTFRGHSPVLPLSERIEALTDRTAFLCDQLQLST